MTWNVGILGATGLVGRACANALSQGKFSRHFKIRMVAGSTESNGKDYAAVFRQKEINLQSHYGSPLWKPREPHPELEELGLRVVPFEEMAEAAGELDFIISSIPPRAGALEDTLLKHGHKVFSNSPYRRYEDDVPLVVLEVNGQRISPWHGAINYVKSPNCVSNGVALVLKPLHEEFGVEAVVLTTYQALSGCGDKKYPVDLVDHNVYPIGKTEENTEEYITKELNKIFSTPPSSPLLRAFNKTENNTLPFKVSVSCQRVFVQHNHFVDMRLITKRKNIKMDEIVHCLQNWNPLVSLQGDMITTPSYPIHVNTEIGLPRPNGCEFHGNNNMRVTVGNIVNKDQIFDIRLSLVVDNTDRGAFGGQLQNAEFVLKQLDMPLDTAVCNNTNVNGARTNGAAINGYHHVESPAQPNTYASKHLVAESERNA